MIISVIVPRNHSPHWEFVKSLVKGIGDNKFSFTEGTSLSDNRNKELEKAKYFNDDLLFIDSDMVFTPKDVAKMKEHLKTKDVVVGVYMLDDPYDYALFERTDNDYKFIKPKNGIHKIGAGGTGFMGISKKVVQAMPLNSFDQIYEGEIKHGDDISFCHRLRENNFELFYDSDIVLGHIRQKIIDPRVINTCKF